MKNTDPRYSEKRLPNMGGPHKKNTKSESKFWSKVLIECILNKNKTGLHIVRVSLKICSAKLTMRKWTRNKIICDTKENCQKSICRRILLWILIFFSIKLTAKP